MTGIRGYSVEGFDKGHLYTYSAVDPLELAKLRAEVKALWEWMDAAEGDRRTYRELMDAINYLKLKRDDPRYAAFSDARTAALERYDKACQNLPARPKVPPDLPPAVQAFLTQP